MAKKEEVALKELHNAVKKQYNEKGRPIDPVLEAIINLLETLTK